MGETESKIEEEGKHSELRKTRHKAKGEDSLGATGRSCWGGGKTGKVARTAQKQTCLHLTPTFAANFREIVWPFQAHL